MLPPDQALPACMHSLSDHTQPADASVQPWRPCGSRLDPVAWARVPTCMCHINMAGSSAAAAGREGRLQALQPTCRKLVVESMSPGPTASTSPAPFLPGASLRAHTYLNASRAVGGWGEVGWGNGVGGLWDGRQDAGQSV